MVRQPGGAEINSIKGDTQNVGYHLTGTITLGKTAPKCWFWAAAHAIVTRSVYRNMEQEPQKDALKQVVPEPPAAPSGPAAPGTAEEPSQVIRPEDEALVVERLRELGYIE